MSLRKVTLCSKFIALWRDFGQTCPFGNATVERHFGPLSATYKQFDRMQVLDGSKIGRSP